MTFPVLVENDNGMAASGIRTALVVAPENGTCVLSWVYNGERQPGKTGHLDFRVTMNDQELLFEKIDNDFVSFNCDGEISYKAFKGVEYRFNMDRSRCSEIRDNQTLGAFKIDFHL